MGRNWGPDPNWQLVWNIESISMCKMKYRIVFDIQKYRYIDMISIYHHPYDPAYLLHSETMSDSYILKNKNEDLLQNGLFS